MDKINLHDAVRFAGSDLEFEAVAFSRDGLTLYLRDNHGLVQAAIEEVEKVEDLDATDSD